jgi:hypothetical protein
LHGSSSERGRSAPEEDQVSSDAILFYTIQDFSGWKRFNFFVVVVIVLVVVVIVVVVDFCRQNLSGLMKGI